MGKRRGKLGCGFGLGLGLWLGLAGLLSGCITPEDDDVGADTDTGPGKASVSGSATDGSDGTTTGPDTSDTNDNSSSPTTASASGSTGGDTDAGTDSTTALGDTGSTSDDSNGVTTASDESGSSTGASAVTFEAHIQPILNANCGCHQNGGTSGQLVLDVGVAYDNLIGIQSTQAAGVVRVEPMDPAASYLWHKLSGTHVDVGGSGNPMPPGGALLDGQLMMFEQWITDGAMP